MDHPSQWARELRVSQQRLSNYLRGRPPNADFLVRLYRVKHVDLHWLLTGEGGPFRSPLGAPSSPAEPERKDMIAAAELSAISFALAGEPELRRAVAALLQRPGAGRGALAVLTRMDGDQLESLVRLLSSLITSGSNLEG